MQFADLFAMLAGRMYYVNTQDIHSGLKVKTVDAISHFGSVKSLADAIGIWPHVIYRWGTCPPMARQYELEVKTGGKLKAEKEVVK